MRIYCFAGANGSGKTTIRDKFKTDTINKLPFVNADSYERRFFSHIKDPDKRSLAAAQFADEKREEYLREEKDFAFETVLSDTTSPHNKLDFLRRAKKQGADITTIYVLIRDKEINVERVETRVKKEGGHVVAEDKIRSRYDKCMKVLPEVIEASDRVILYDNSVKGQTSIMFHKQSDEAVVFSENPKEDTFLQDTLIKPLEEKYNYNFIYCRNLSGLDIYSEHDLSDFIQKVKTDYLPENSQAK